MTKRLSCSILIYCLQPWAKHSPRLRLYYASSIYLFIFKPLVFAKCLEGWSAMNWKWEASKGTFGGVHMVCYMWHECLHVWYDLVMSELLWVSCWFAFACFCIVQQKHSGKSGVHTFFTSSVRKTVKCYFYWLCLCPKCETSTAGSAIPTERLSHESVFSKLLDVTVTFSSLLFIKDFGK